MNEFLIKFQHILCKNIIDCDVIASKMVKDGNDAGWRQWLLAFRVDEWVWVQAVVLHPRHISNKLTHGWVVWWFFYLNQLWLKIYVVPKSYSWIFLGFYSFKSSCYITSMAFCFSVMEKFSLFLFFTSHFIPSGVVRENGEPKALFSVCFTSSTVTTRQSLYICPVAFIIFAASYNA